MARDIILASGSATRRMMLENAGVPITVSPVRVDEEAIRQALAAEGIKPRDIADALAEQKARRGAGRHPAALVIGSDQVLEFEGEALGKCATPDALRAQLDRMNGKRHDLHSAAVIYEDGQPVWRHVSRARMQMRLASDGYLDDYVARNWDSVKGSVGGYLVEGEGIRLFSRVDGDTFTVLGLPLLELVNYLMLRKELTG